MEEYKVLLTTSGIGSRLGTLTNFTNKSLVRISDKPAISHIIEYYPKNIPFVVTIGHFGSYVRQFLKLAYPDRDFTFVDIDKFEGPGSSLGYSILQAKNELQCPFIFHASDTILTKNDIPIGVDSNWCVGSHQDDSSQYSTFIVSNGDIDDINEKGAIHYDYCYIGMCGIKDYKLFWTELENIPNTQSLTDIHIIKNMLLNVPFKFYETMGWFDTGNTSKLKKVQEFFKSGINILDKSDESIYFFKDFVIKFFANTTINKNRIKRASILKGLVPEIIGTDSNFYKYKKAEGKLFATSANVKSFTYFLDWVKDNLWKEKESDNFSKSCLDFYIHKTESRLNLYLNGVPDVSETINGELIPPIQDLISQIDIDWLCDGVPVQFHGDFILDNVIETKNGFSLIDWRQDFANDLEVGDIYYDLAKLNHNLTVNHSIIDKKLYNSSPDNCYILCNSTLLRCKEVLHNFIKENGYNLKKVEILTSIIWLNMAPLHEYPFNNFLFNFGKYNLYKTLNVS